MPAASGRIRIRAEKSHQPPHRVGVAQNKQHPHARHYRSTPSNVSPVRPLQDQQCPQRQHIHHGSPEIRLYPDRKNHRGCQQRHHSHIFPRRTPRFSSLHRKQQQKNRFGNFGGLQQKISQGKPSLHPINTHAPDRQQYQRPNRQQRIPPTCPDVNCEGNAGGNRHDPGSNNRK